MKSKRAQRPKLGFKPKPPEAPVEPTEYIDHACSLNIIDEIIFPPGGGERPKDLKEICAKLLAALPADALGNHSISYETDYGTGGYDCYCKPRSLVYVTWVERKKNTHLTADIKAYEKKNAAYEVDIAKYNVDLEAFNAWDAKENKRRTLAEVAKLEKTLAALKKKLKT